MMSASSVLFFLFSFVYTALALVPDPEFERQVGKSLYTVSFYLYKF
jgi:hypothetical protein